MGATVETILGKDLSMEDLESINYYRKKEFHTNSDIQPAPDSDEWEKPYFLVRDENGRLMAFGRLHHLKVTFRGVEYQVLGIATILATEKRKGYGRMVLEMMKKYSHDAKKTAIGFCDPEDSGFYLKCGLGVTEGMERFVFPSGPKSKGPGKTIYIEEDDGLIEEMKKFPTEKVISSREEW